MSVKSLVIIVEMRSDTPNGSSLGLRITYSNVEHLPRMFGYGFCFIQRQHSTDAVPSCGGKIAFETGQGKVCDTNSVRN